MRALLKNLPADSATYRAIGGDWTTQTELAAAQLEVTHSLLRTYISAHVKQGARLPEPLRVPRPWDTQSTKRRSGTTLAELRQIAGLQTKNVRS